MIENYKQALELAIEYLREVPDDRCNINWGDGIEPEDVIEWLKDISEFIDE